MCRFVLGVALLAVLVLFAVGALADDVCRCGGQKSEKSATTRTLTTRFTYKAVVPEFSLTSFACPVSLPSLSSRIVRRREQGFRVAVKVAEGFCPLDSDGNCNWANRNKFC